MGDFKRNFQSGGNRGGQRFGRDSGRRSFGERNSDRTMHSAKCAECGNDCEVPFLPTGDRPVYCGKCFEKRNQSGEGARDSGRNNFNRSRPDDRRSSQPTFNNAGNAGNALNGQILNELRSLNAKLDKIVRTFEPKVEKPQVVEPAAVETKAKKPKTSKSKTAKGKAKV